MAVKRHARERQIDKSDPLNLFTTSRRRRRCRRSNNRNPERAEIMTEEFDAGGFAARITITGRGEISRKRRKRRKSRRRYSAPERINGPSEFVGCTCRQIRLIVVASEQRASRTEGKGGSVGGKSNPHLGGGKRRRRRRAGIIFYQNRRGAIYSRRGTIRARRARHSRATESSGALKPPPGGSEFQIESKGRLRCCFRRKVTPKENNYLIYYLSFDGAK